MKAPAGLGEFFLSQPVLLSIDLRPKFVQVGDSFPEAVVIVCCAEKRFPQSVTGFANLQINVKPKNVVFRKNLEI